MKNLALSLVVISLLFIGCSDEKEAAITQPKMVQMPALPVKGQVVKYEKVDFSKSYSAVLKPFREVNIVARVRGILEKKNFTEGAFVKKGEIIYEIEKDGYKAAFDEAKGALLKAEANFNKTSNDWKRGEYLFKNSAISEQQRDELLYAYADAKAEMQKAKAAAAKAELNYGYTTIKAPISGMIGMSNNDVGTYIDFDAQNATLTTITVVDPVYAEFSLPSSDVSRYASHIKTGLKVTLNKGSKSFIGEVDYIAPKVDTQTDTLLFRATFKNPNTELIIGSYVEVSMAGFSYESVVKIPQNALMKTPEAILVYVTKNGEISMRAVEVLQVIDGVALVSKGLNEGESVVVSNIAKLRPGSKVVIMDGN
ncbi:efflux RND transporter periplasmic adaptor subunit [Sulfurimonas sp.]|jgi:membrane fusion protein (multidrug efflux system)|uniref:efflux RND transporter periplasmic adaptor subunit n=1 Tax=Sulfurimonas sp. TaxID=2022749 RepID=UPI0025F39F3C|nr:efflux RND transporter periplasmic adaptor subunit [Sulfurimonas sp.]MCK9473590.1 efflux RND transporter periplasmic adaptor subunit [Sulfurimonas sp.]MDD3506424.1 efflux RND transporter periplasmic adaptor subunit [Sulfurimonas sp.]